MLWVDPIYKHYRGEKSHAFKNTSVFPAAYEKTLSISEL